MSLKSRGVLIQDEPGGDSACWGLIISMEDGERLSLAPIRTFVEAGEEIRFHSQDRRELYAWVNQTLGRQVSARPRKSLRASHIPTGSAKRGKVENLERLRPSTRAVNDA